MISQQILRWGIALSILNVFDAGVSVFFLSQGFEEMNPIMAWLYSVSPVFFVLFKVSLLTACLVYLYLNTTDRKVVWAIKGLTLLYGLTAAYHIAGLVHSYGGR